MNTNLLSSLFIGEILPSKLDLLDLKKKKKEILMVLICTTELFPNIVEIGNETIWKQTAL